MFGFLKTSFGKGLHLQKCVVKELWLKVKESWSNILISTRQSLALAEELKDGSKKAVIKNIYKAFRKPKDKLVDFVVQYNGSLVDFQEHVKENYPSIDFDQLMDLHGKAS